ncbi:MAG: glutamate-1-semialdehyde 2,1-aminomutase [Nitrospirae bacterium]|nr:glutamate-1-semialdehyde 2,1-aminomutase [Nitrospirota bacterium]
MVDDFKKSALYFKRALELIPGGVNSPVRAFKAVGGNPVFMSQGKGSKIFDVDGNIFIDYVLSWGPMILGHANQLVTSAIKKAVEHGTSFGAPTPMEVKLAELVVEFFPSIERLRFVNSGTEATMSAIRVARAYAGRDKIIKFEGCYHGHADGLLSKAGSGATTLGVPTSPGVPANCAQNTITLPFNDLETIKSVIERDWRDIACVILEPIVGNMGCIIPRPGFLEGIRDLTAKHGIVLIFDEVMTGFRASRGGAQELYGIKPDMTCLGKVIGGGLPVGAYGGKAEIMELVAPQGPVYQAGTLSGNPVAMAAGFETLKILSKKDVCENMEEKAKELEEGIKDAARITRVDVRIYRVGTMFCVYFTNNEVVDYSTALSSDTKKFANYFKTMLHNGIYIAPSQFEAGFLSMAHTERDIKLTIKKAYKALKSLSA